MHAAAVDDQVIPLPAREKHRWERPRLRVTPLDRPNRIGEVEEVLLEDLDLPGKMLVVRQGKGQKDRVVYLTAAVIAAPALDSVRTSTRTDWVTR